MKYYLHDANSFNDEKITELFMNFGYEGLGLFYTVLEKLASQEKPIKTVVLKRQLNVGKKLEKCWLFMESLGIISSINGETFNERILSYSENYKIKKEKNAKRIAEWRENQEVIKNVTRYEQVSNTPKVKESKVNRSKENNIFNAHQILKNDFFIDEILINDFLQVRKNKKAPLTQTAWTGFVNECNKHNFNISDALKICCEKNWQTFKYEWYLNQNKNLNGITNNTAESYKDRTARELDAIFAKRYGHSTN